MLRYFYLPKELRSLRSFFYIEKRLYISIVDLSFMPISSYVFLPKNKNTDCRSGMLFVFLKLTNISFFSQLSWFFAFLSMRFRAWYSCSITSSPVFQSFSIGSSLSFLAKSSCLLIFPKLFWSIAAQCTSLSKKS